LALAATGNAGAGSSTNTTQPTLSLGSLDGVGMRAGDVIELIGTDGSTVVGRYTVKSSDLNAGVWNAGAKDITVTVPLSQGAHTLGVRLSDAAGNAGPASSSKTNINVDTVAPGAPKLTLASGVASGASGAEATAGAVNVSGEAGATISVLFSDGTNTVTKTITATGAVQSVALSSEELGRLKDGKISVSASQTDAAGNAQTALASSTSFSLDTVGPDELSNITLQFSESENPGFFGRINTQTPTPILGKLDGVRMVAGDVIELLGTDLSTVVGSYTVKTADVSAGVWSAGDKNIAVNVPLSQGVHILGARLSDAAGNAGAGRAINFFSLDSVAPTLAITSNASTLKAGETAIITFTYSEEAENDRRIVVGGGRQ
jgi:hypothetical protein